MSKTLFWYLFRDLARIFILACGTLAGIMSFGGLLRPLTENGLNAAQVGKLLTYLTPAMMAYSLPAAALFATTVTYGRLAADNELTACRAAGMSYTAIGLPAVVLGLFVAIFSLFLLCFVVPVYSLKVEEVILSNLGQVMVNKIQHDHQIHPGGSFPWTVYAESARLLPPEADHPRDELVELTGPTVVNYDVADKATDLRVPRDFYTAQSATLRIHPAEDAGSSTASGRVRIDIALSGGVKFPRQFTGADRSQAGVDAISAPPRWQDNPIRQNVKFMDISTLLRLAANPGQAQRVTDVVDELRRRDEEHALLAGLAADPTGSGVHSLQTATTPPQTYILSTDGPPPQLKSGRHEDELIFSSEPNKKQIRLTVIQEEQTTRTAVAAEAVLHAAADDAAGLFSVSLELHNLTMRTADLDQRAAPADLSTWSATLDVPMPEAIREFRATHTLATYAADPNLNPDDADELRRQQVVVNNDVRAELHGRASFSVSCLILVLIGCALGMMFKSGNFLTAFAVSFAPALLCVALVVAGQQTADHVPVHVSANFLSHNRPLVLGLGLIWSGNAIVLALAAVLIVRLRRR